MNHTTYLYRRGFTADDWQRLWQKLEMRLCGIDEGARKERHFITAVVKIGPKFKAFFTRLKGSNPDLLARWACMCEQTTEHAHLDEELRQEWNSFVFDPATRTEAEVQMQNAICFVDGSQQT